ncbi:MAG: hypothetical protein H6550_14715 [Chitinophagales bacterium]|nr:hypothetical protein [Chitinophagales bacterium]
MKKYCLLLVASVVLFCFTGCERSRHRTISGQIIEYNDKLPIRTTTFTLFVSEYPGGMNGTLKVNKILFTTDDNGRFQFGFDAKNNETLGIAYANGAPSNGNTFYWTTGVGKTKKVETGIIEADRR